MSLFNYQLKPVTECLFPITADGRKSVCWFWLTDSFYHIDLGTAKLFESSPAWQKKYGLPASQLPYDEYVYARQLEDLFAILPAITAPIPPDVFAIVDSPEKRRTIRAQLKAWYAGKNDPTDQEDELHNDITDLVWWNNALDTAYLQYHANCWFCRIEDRMIIQYDFNDTDADGVPVWSARTGSHEMPYEEFVWELHDLLARFVRDMDQQIEEAIALLSPDQYILNKGSETKNTKKDSVKTGADYLRIEHAERRNFFLQALTHLQSPSVTIDWERLLGQYKAWQTIMNG